MSAISFSVSTITSFFLHIVWLTWCRAAVASKCGFDVFGPQRTVTNSAAHIKEYIEGTIDRLGFTPDLYYLHRTDPSTY
jgi:aryl-alcohol dehydrogenase-like predicted oxidoreductase